MATLLDRLAIFVATGFGVGRAPRAPGTCGTLAAVPLYLLLQAAGPAWYIFVTVTMFGAGIWICDRASRHLGDDAPSIVWDEIVGFLVAMVLAPAAWVWLVVGFALFRFFDITKPFPIGTIDRRLHGGFGTMLDDVLAGIYTLVLLQLAVALI